MIDVKVTAVSDATDLDYLKRRIEKLGFTATRFGKELFVAVGLWQSPADGFRLSQLLHNNSPALIKFEVSTELDKEWCKEDETVKRS